MILLTCLITTGVGRHNLLKIITTYLKEDPRPDFESVRDHLLRPRSLSLSQRDRKHPFGHLHLLCEFVQVGCRISSGREHKNQRNSRSGLLKHGRQITSLGFDKTLSQVFSDEVLHHVGHFIWTNAFEDHHSPEHIDGFNELRREGLSGRESVLGRFN